MRIAAIHVYQRNLALPGGPLRMGRISLESADATVVQVVSDDGSVGWGETCPAGPLYQPHHALGARAALAEIAPGLIGLDPLAIDLVRTSMDERLNGHGYAKAAIDIALWDLMGKNFGVRVCDLLGGARRERVPSYAAVYAPDPSDPAEVAHLAKDLVQQGYKRLQIKLHGQPIEMDIEAIRRVFEQIGTQVRLVVDANRAWTTRDTILFSTQCRDIPLIIEQPCKTMDEIAAIRPSLSHPLYLDESADSLESILYALGQGLCDGFGMKITRVGGLSAMRLVRDFCAARSMPHTCDDAFGGDIIAAACVHIGSTVQSVLFDGTWIAAPYIEESYDPDNPISIDRAEIPLPTGLGLGIDPCEHRFGAPCASYG